MNGETLHAPDIILSGISNQENSEADTVFGRKDYADEEMVKNTMHCKSRVGSSPSGAFFLSNTAHACMHGYV